MPNSHRFGASALIHFKTDGLEKALITLGNDEVLDVFDESKWRDGKPFLAVECEGGGYAQIGNVRVLLANKLFSKLTQHVRSVREKWLEIAAIRNRELEAEGYQHIAEGRIKLGRIRADMWRYMIHFAMEHDIDKGHSPWHIFDASSSQVKIYTKDQTTEMDSGYHLILSTWPPVNASTGGNENVDLIWNAPSAVRRGAPARGRRGYWGCETAVIWLKEKFLPMLISLHWAKDTRTLTQRLFGHSLELYHPKRMSFSTFKKQRIGPASKF